MTTPDDLIPGKELEKAAANVATEAGKSLVRGIARTFGALTAEWVAKKEARAEATRTAIQTNAEIERIYALTETRRISELTEIEHQTKIELAKRRGDRMIYEMAREQENLETIARLAIESIEKEAADETPREIDDDWFFRFSKFAENVSDEIVQKLWARVLQSAASKSRYKLSPAALFQLSLVERDTAVDFQNFCQVIKSFGLFAIQSGPHVSGTLKIDIQNLEEMGLIVASSRTKYEFSDFGLEIGNSPNIFGNIPFQHSALTLTQRGSEIADAVFSGPGTLSVLSEEEQERFLQDLVSMLLANYEYGVIVPPDANRYFVLHSRNAAVEPIQEAAWKEILAATPLSSRLRNLLRWSFENYSISVHDVPVGHRD
jgi:uncharacterized protein DUF2806